MNIPLWQPSLGELENKAIQKVLTNSYLGMGKNVFDFEKDVANDIGINEDFVVATHTGQSALHTILETFKENNENLNLVISPSMNNIADFQAVVNSGFELFFADCYKDSGLINLDSIPDKVLDNAGGLIVLDYASNYVDLKLAKDLCDKYSIKLIYDAAHSFGSINSKRTKLADATMFSFDPIKTFTAIDAGIIIWNKIHYASCSRSIRHMGMGQDLEALKNNARSGDYDVKVTGYRYHLSNIHAACGSTQISRKEEIKSKRTKLLKTIRSELSKCNLIEGWVPIDDSFAPFMNVAFIAPKKKNALSEKLKIEGIQTGVHWKPGHFFTKFSSTNRSDMLGTETFFDRILSFPLFTDMNESQVNFLIDSILKIDKEF